MNNWCIVHSAKGTQWKKHKYIRKVGDRYYYKSDVLNQKADHKTHLALSTPNHDKGGMEWDKHTNIGGPHENVQEYVYRNARAAGILRTKANKAESEERANRMAAFAELTAANIGLKAKKGKEKVNKILGFFKHG